MKIFLPCVLLCATICLADRGKTCSAFCLKSYIILYFLLQTSVAYIVLLSTHIATEGSKPVSLQPWLLGLTAVVGFLLLVFIILVIQRLLKKRFVFRKKEEKSFSLSLSVLHPRLFDLHSNKSIENLLK
uniref:Uncharacterized protein n=1 Tax=Oreochromis aureus TaxID=47969 RepID=A0A668TFR2_OREAU